jgi:hypothetical protein
VIIHQKKPGTNPQRDNFIMGKLMNCAEEQEKLS